MENLSDLRDRLISMEDMGEFKKLFIFFSCATLLAPTSKLDGSHELWCTLLAGDFDINVNWANLYLTHWLLELYIFDWLFYVNKFYIPTMLVTRTIPICATWIDDLMKKMVHVELQDYGDFGLVDLKDEVRMNANSLPDWTSSNTFISATSTCYCLQSPYVVQPSIKISASSSVAKQVLAYALDNTRDERKVVTMHCRILNGMDKENRKHFLSPNFVSDVENKRGTLSPKYMTDCGIFVIKFTQLWSNDGLSRAIANDNVIKYREKLLTQLIMSPENEVRENVYQAMDL
ncbi:hypothetical protein CK203_089499 [Vitis vinifera]|uniref:Ubiquitin-like protease family profile domain-containing protein n=1 Tax=Vitis vinifera TaxID=29760 RepID=A0A438FJ51_VITVI|nr:hypothetical protein CK203_089499 [Vitis vinifera]